MYKCSYKLSSDKQRLAYVILTLYAPCLIFIVPSFALILYGTRKLLRIKEFHVSKKSLLFDSEYCAAVL